MSGPELNDIYLQISNSTSIDYDDDDVTISFYFVVIVVNLANFVN